MDEEKKPDLLEPTYPLLSEFKKCCPGTVKHSQAVVDLVESISQSIDIDPHDLKVAAMYHDIGKMVNSEYFSENQREENPHDSMDPMVSFQIISRHVSDSVLLLVGEKDFSRKIIEIISQHHGSTILKQFFKKSDIKDENIFRYPGKSPTSIESAILMICDSVEAIAQSLFQTHKEIDSKSLVEDKINLLLDDGQLDDVTMRLGDLKKIKEALQKEIEAMIPKRVDYDEEESERLQENAKRKKKKEIVDGQ